MKRKRGGNLLRSNLQNWVALQERDYFEGHIYYGGLRDLGGDTTALIERFVKLTPKMRVAVIGCGYGRETVHIAPRVAHVFGIDVSDRIMRKASEFLLARGIHNFTPILAQRYEHDVPDGLDLVFSMIVMQHLTRDLVRDYFTKLGRKLCQSGSFVVQFLEELLEGVESADAELRDYEPSVSWTVTQLEQLARLSNLTFREVRTYKVTETALWHWVWFSNDGPKLHSFW
jgi:SAM-dependent methyltransferase